MAELYNDKNRVIFQKNKQTEFIKSVEKVLQVETRGIANILKVNTKTVLGWKKEKFSMPLFAVRHLSNKSSIEFPKNIKIKDRYWYVHKGSKKGGMALIKKYGRIPVDPQYRKEKWREWWNSRGKFMSTNFPNKPLPFNRPKPSEDLAEFFGIMMGDGGATRWQISITLHHIDDLEYSLYVISLIKKLFDVVPSIIHVPRGSVNRIEVSRTGLVTHIHSLGIVIGNKVKQEFDIPKWIKINSKYCVACVRGLVDTDGCVFKNKYKINSKWYSYTKIDFISASTPLRESVVYILRDLGMNPSISGRHVRLNSRKDVENYFKIVGSHNQKHLKKYYNQVTW